jgi:epoxyqueuosine reductase
MKAMERTRWIVERARAEGFDLCGVAPAELFAELERLPEWLAAGYAGEMKYLRDARRGDPRLALEGARSVIVVALNYNTAQLHTPGYSMDGKRGRNLDQCAASEATATGNGNSSGAKAPHLSAAVMSELKLRPSKQAEGNEEHFDDAARGWISRYAWGDDYHDVLREKLNRVVATMHEEFAEPFEARAHVDTGPIIERVAAKYAGLGWLAKNTCLINQKLGSWLFLGVIVTTLELEPSLGADVGPPRDLCGTCTRCLDACPTDAFPQAYVLDSRRCISYLTIELRGAIPEESREGVGTAVIGCDICQDVCPWNRKAPVTAMAEFEPREFCAEGSARGTSFLLPELEWLASLTQEEFSRAFRKSAAKRAKWRGLVRNACVALGNAEFSASTAARERAVALLARLAGSEDALIAEHARWALERVSSHR